MVPVTKEMAEKLGAAAGKAMVDGIFKSPSFLNTELGATSNMSDKSVKTGVMTECGCKNAAERKTCTGFEKHSNDPDVCIHLRFDEFCVNEKLTGGGTDVVIVP